MFTFFVVWFSRLVMTGDDFSWSDPWWWFKDFNMFKYDGRYLANLLNIALSKLFWLRVTLMPLMLTSLFVLLAYLINKKLPAALLLTSFMMFFVTPTQILRQVFNWVSGFSVYIYPVLWTLIALIYFKKLINHDAPNISKWWVLSFAVIGQFGSENVTIGNVFLSILLIVGVRYFNREKIQQAYFYGAGILIGAIGQLSNQAYWRIFVDKNDSYRSVGGGLSKYFKTIKEVLVPSATNQQWPLMAIISLSLLAIVILSWRKFNGWQRGVVLFTSIYDGIFGYFIFNHSNSIMTFDQKYGMPLLLLTLGFFLINAIMAIFITRKNRERFFLVLPLLMAIIYLAPFVVVTPFGPRGIFASFIMLVIFTLELVDMALDLGQLPLKIFVRLRRLL